MLATFYIYTLTNPKSGHVFYVGCTTDPDTRLKAHKSKSCWDKTLRRKYIDESRIKPVMEIVDKVTGDVVEKHPRACREAVELEAKWINVYRKSGHLLVNGELPIRFRISTTLKTA